MIVKRFSEYIEDIYESIAPGTDIEDVLAKKIGIDKLFRFTRQDDGSYVSKPMDKVYPSSGVFQAMMDNSWTFIDLYRNDDLNMYRARRCYFNGEDPKETFKGSKYKVSHVTPVYNELVSTINSLPNVLKDMISIDTVWMVISPDKGICMICEKVDYRYVMRIFFTGLRNYGRISSKTKDILRKKRLASINKKRAATNAIRKAEEEEYNKREAEREAERQAKEEEKRIKKEEDERKYREEVDAWKKSNPKDAEIIQYIYDTYYNNNMHSSSLKKNKIYDVQGKYRISQIPVQIVDGKLYFDPMFIDVIDIQDIMKDVSKKFGIDAYYEYDSDWNIKDDVSRYGTKPITDFDEWEEEWSEPDRFFLSHRTLKKKSED